MLQPAADHTGNSNVFRLFRDPRTQAADSTDKELYLNTRFGAFNQLSHDIRVVHGVDFDCHTAVLTLCDLCIQKFQNSAFEGQRCNPELMGLGRQLPVHQRCKGSFGIGSGLFICRNKRKVCILFAGDLVIVAGADLCNVGNDPVALSCDQAELAVNFIFRKAVDHTAARILQHLGIVNIVLLVESGAKLQKAQHILAPICRIGKRCCNLAADRHAVQRDLDGGYFRVICSFIDEIDKLQHTLKRVAHQQIMLFYIAEIIPFLQPDIPCRLAGLIAEFRMALDTGSEREVKRNCGCEDKTLRHAKLFQKQCSGRVSQFSVNLNTYRHFAFPLGQEGRHFLPQVFIAAVFHAGEKHVGISCHFNNGRLHHRFLFQQQRQKMADQLRGQNNFLAAVDFKREIAGQAAERNDRQLLLNVFPQKCHDVGFLSPEERHGLVDIKDRGSYSVFHVAEELLAHQIVDLADLFEV